MNRKTLLILVAILVLLVVIYIAFFSAARPPFFPSSPTSTPPAGSSTGNTTSFPLSLPAGFSISTFAKDLPHARMMVFDSFGNLWVSQPNEGAVSMLEIDRDTGAVKRQGAVFRNLNRPHGLAIEPGGNMLYIAEESKVSRVTLYSDDRLHQIAALPTGGNHWTRTLGFGPDKRLYVSIGSTCNACREEDDRRATIFSMKPDGSDFREFAHGLRNAVFFAWHPATGKMWATEMGRDNLGDDVPPDEINVVEAGKDYGWPVCYGKNMTDAEFTKDIQFIRNPCMEPFETPSMIDIQAHSAPLGLAFVPQGAGWPTDYEGDLLVAYHGSWNRSVPAGYKIVRHKFSASGAYEGAEDFVMGWIRPGEDEDDVRGRPVHLLFDQKGVLYVTDDKAGVIYKIEPSA